MPRHTFSVGALLVAGLAATGCTAGGPDPTPPTGTTSATASAPTPSPPTTATPTPTPTYWTKAEAARQYLAIVKPANDDIRRLMADSGSNDIKRINAGCVRVADAMAKQLRDLEQGQWEPSLRPAVEDLQASTAAIRGFYLACSRASSIADFNAIPAPNDPHSGAADVLRAKLGLDPVPAS